MSISNRGPDEFCRSCRGTGRVLDVINSMEDFAFVPCQECSGSGCRSERGVVQIPITTKSIDDDYVSLSREMDDMKIRLSSALRLARDFLDGRTTDVAIKELTDLEGLL